MDALVFLAAFLYGLRIGVGVAGSTWLVYGFINPNGTDDLILLFFLIIGECFYAIAGGLLRRTTITRELLAEKGPFARTSLLFGTVGMLATLAYDVLTNFASWLFRTTSLYDSLIFGLITGAPFALVHEVSNLLLFATATPAAILAARRFNRILVPETKIL